MTKKLQWIVVKETDKYIYVEKHSNPYCKKSLQDGKNCKCDLVRYNRITK